MCPRSGEQGIPVQLITLKSLLFPRALAQLDADSNYAFCRDPICPVVYFSEQGQSFGVDDLKVPVFQKESGEDVPVCYCFAWTRRRIRQELQGSTTPQAILAEIAAHIKARRCGCQVNNPQGFCCLENVRQVILEVQQEKVGERDS
ncbi:putative iron-sulfur cluster-binding metallochaperone [Synechococcus sp. B60.1]|uniref:putative iron-sulfur cluster-binding metallochaperone n=1 Tax=unclassified Synechococcus TaxID=2626047 RepID=UPI0039C44CD4